MVNPQVLEELKKARGDRFVFLLKQVYAEVSPELAEHAKQMIKKTGKLTPTDVGVLALRFNLQLKHAFEFLEEQMILPCGTYDRLRDRGLKVADVMQRAKAQIE